MTEKRFRFNGRSNTIEYDGKSILLDSYGEEIEDLLNKQDKIISELAFLLKKCCGKEYDKITKEVTCE